MASNPSDVSYLQGKGKKVMLSLGGSPDAGGKFPPTTAAVPSLLKDIIAIVQKWKLDGVDIDDEVLTHDDDSIDVLIALVKGLKADPGMSGKRLSLTAQCVYVLPDGTTTDW